MRPGAGRPSMRTRLPWVDERKGPPRVPPRILRRRRSGRRRGRARARQARRPRLRAETDRAQPACRARSRIQGRRVRRGGEGGARGRGRRALRARRRSGCVLELEGSRSGGHRRHVSARHQGAHGGSPVRAGRAHDRPDRTRRARGGRGDDGPGSGTDDPRPEPRGGPDRPDRRPRQPLLPHPDHPVRRRDRRDPRDPPSAVPRDRGSAARGHLLRHHEPPGRRQGARATRGRPAGDRLEELIELEPPGGGERRARHAGLPGGRRDPRGPGVARGRRDGRTHVGRVRARVARRSHARVPRVATGSTTSRS